VILLCLLLIQAVWLGAAPVDEHLHFERLGHREGFPSATVYCGFEDSRGFLWFGTADGAARYDSQEFMVYRPVPGDAESLVNGCVLAFAEDSSGDLWLATEGALTLWHRDTERFSHYRHADNDPSSISDNTTQSLALDPDGSLWVGTKYGGLNRLDTKTGRFERFTPLLGAPDDPWIRCLCLDSQGVLWIGTSNSGLAQYDKRTRRFKTFAHSPGDPQSLCNNRVNAIVEDASGGLWVGTDRGLCRLNRERTGFTQYPLREALPDSMPNETVSGILIDRDGSLWIGTDGGGLCRLNSTTGALLRHRSKEYSGNSIVSDSIRALLQDSHGDLWIGHFPSGLSHSDRIASSFQIFSNVPGQAETLSDNHVLCFLEDPAGDLWIGSDNGGVTHWSPDGKWTSYRHRPADSTSLGAKAALTLCRDRLGTLWVGTWDGGLNRFDASSGSFVRYLPNPADPASLSDTHVWQILEDPKGRLWLATIGGGVELYDPNTDSFIHHRHDPKVENSLPDDIVSSMLVTRDGTLWAGTPGGIVRRDEKTGAWLRVQGGPNDPGTGDHYWVFDLLEDKTGRIWASTEGGGLFCMDTRTGGSRRYRVSDGLPSEILRGLLEDDDGRIWIGSNQGLASLDPASGRVRVFDESNGLPSGLFPPHARLRLASGDLLFGTSKGFVRFTPGALKEDPTPPRVVLTEFAVFNQAARPAVQDSPLKRSISETTRIDLPASDSVFSFKFAALNFRAPDRSQYRFRLEGFDTDWRKPGPEHRATYTNIDPGRYVFRVKAANGDGVWNEKGTSVELVIIPPWWRTVPFRIALFLGIVGGAASIGWAVSAHRTREELRQRELEVERDRVRDRELAAEKLRCLNLELEQRVQERTAQLQMSNQELEAFSYSVSHDLRAPLRSINGFSRILLEDHRERLNAEAVETINVIRAATQRMGQLIDDMLQLSRVARAELHKADFDISALAQELSTEIADEYPKLRVELVIQPGLSAHADRNLMRSVLQNLLSNAWKFSSKQETARIEFGREQLETETCFFVKDNGVGFPPEYGHKLFNPFQRLHARDEFPGTGVGLAIIQRIVHRHGGRVWAESSLGNGAVFRFTLPANTKQP
jgi:signal transduction histidine kinase/ligand-binding sensor domain-containing protein